MDEIEIKTTKQVEIRPFKCVVCNSFGTLRYGKEVCHACKGKGYILVSQELEVDPNKI